MKITCVGEGMIEVTDALAGADHACMGFGGDTLNTAIYLSRLLQGGGDRIAFATLLGDDPFSTAMIKAWKAEGLCTDLVEQCEGREVGLYAIHVDDRGERSFRYWRSQAPVREMFDGVSGEMRLERLSQSDVLFFSGITLAVLFEEGCERFLALAQRMKAEGRMVVFDTNHRARLWDGRDAAWIYRQALEAATLVLPSEEDLIGAFGDQAQDWRTVLEEYGIPEVVLKHSGRHVDLFVDGAWEMIDLECLVDPVDTTAAGDSFNAGYLAARLRGTRAAAAVVAGHRLASAVIMCPGAIIARADMPQERGET